MYSLVMRWKYDYDKESTWFDSDEGVERYALEEGAAYPLPHLRGKHLTLTSLTRDGGAVTVSLCVDYHTVTVTSNGESVTAHASDSYSVAGDSVHQSLYLDFSLERE